jgi:ATP-dependent DNA helicase UvrD/PcrA
VNFTSDQLQAIDHSKGNLQLIACAGSGKTEVVARRVANLLKTGKAQGLTPAGIVAFTFTDKAAAELKERIVTRCREELGDIVGMAEMYVGTIHGYCLDLLKTEVPEYLKYGVLNEVQQTLLVDRSSRASGLTASTDLNGASLQRFTDTSRYVAALGILREARLNDKKLKGVSVVDGLKLYQALLAEKRYLDYSAIMVQAVRAVAQDKSLQKRLAARIKHVIVDEYQDVNPIQECIVKLLHDLGAHVCVVGDDDQTIYQWRGSDITNINSFATRYPKVQKVRLQENFRSSKGVVETARDFISQNTKRLAKAMVPTNAQPFETGDIVALALDNPKAEAEFIATTVKQLRGIAFQDGDRTRGLSYSDCAILLRSVKANADPIVSALKATGIPAIIIGMNHLFDTQEAQAARLIFYFMVDRNGTDRDTLRNAWLGANVGVKPLKLDFAIDKLQEAKGDLKSPDQKRWGFYSLQRQYLNFLENAELREEVVPEGAEGIDRGEVVFYNLGKFSQLISDFEEIHFHSKPQDKYETFAGFLEHHAEDTYPEGWQDNQYANPDAVRIMTIHQAKGMQWPAVFIPALLRNRFPAAGIGGRSVWHLIPKDGIQDQARFDGGIEDERRLFYVAMTRSQKFLYMTWAPIPGKNNRYARASEFWDNILASKWVKRRLPDYSARKRRSPEPRAGVSNVVLTFSDLKYFFECPYQFKLRVLYGFNSPIHEALGYGKSLHDALAEVHARAIRGDVPDESDVSKLVKTHLHVPFAYQSLRETLETSAKDVLRAYLKKNKPIFSKIEFAEKTIDLHLDDGVSVVGRIDLVRRIDTDEVTIVDLKTSERAQAEDVTETQLHIYALGYQELTGRRADYVETYELEEQKSKPRSVDDDFIADVRNNVKTAASALRLGALPPKPSAVACKNCDYQKMCTAGSGFPSKKAQGK